MTHTRSALDAELRNIRDDILRLASLVNHASRRAIEAFTHHDEAIAHEVIAGDDEIDRLHHSLEEGIVRTVALQQPMATDLRRLIAGLLITNELERMGDHAEGIARTVLRYEWSAQVDVPPALGEMSERVSQMLDATMDAYLDMSPDRARIAARKDDEIDTLYQEFFARIVDQMSSGQMDSERGTYLLWTGHNLERIGDRVTNICERIVYAHTGDMGGLNPKHDGE